MGGKPDVLEFSGHAIRRMFERDISIEEVRDVVRNGETVAEYPQDTPYPSILILGMVGDRPLHVVLATDPDTGKGTVVTAYQPDADLWETGFRQRRRR